MSLFSSAPFSNLTIYRKDYTGKTCPRRPITKFFPGLPNPVVGGLAEYVLPRFRYEKLPCTQTEYPDPKKYAEEVAEKYPASRVILKDGDPLDLDVVDNLYIDENRSVYMISYCDRGECWDLKSGRMRKKHVLPDDWEIPLTTYRCSYRHPYMLTGGIIKVIRHPRDHLCPSMRERQTLGVETGETIYNTDISKTGAEIIRGKLHGDVSIRPTFDEEDLLKTKLLRKD